VAGESGGELKRFVDTMIFDLIAGIVVGSNLVGAIGLADILAGRGNGRHFFVFFDLPQFSFDHF